MIKGELFNQDMVKAFLEGRKSRTSRPIKPQPNRHFEVHENPFYLYDVEFNKGIINPKYQVGDIMYARETFNNTETTSVLYDADFINLGQKEVDEYLFMESEIKWRPSIHMPREAARLWFRVTDVKAQNIVNMTEQDAEQDGFISDAVLTPSKIDYIGLYALDRFDQFWHNQYGTDANWMWVYYLKQISKEEAKAE